MKATSKVKNGAFAQLNRCGPAGVKVKMSIKAGGVWRNHNQTAVRVKSGVKAGQSPVKGRCD